MADTKSPVISSIEGSAIDHPKPRDGTAVPFVEFRTRSGVGGFAGNDYSIRIATAAIPQLAKVLMENSQHVAIDAEEIDVHVDREKQAAMLTVVCPAGVLTISLSLGSLEKLRSQI